MGTLTFFLRFFLAMRCLFFISLFFVLSSGVEDQTVKAVIKKPRMFASVLSKINPGESAQTAADVQSLIDTGEEERKVADAAMDVAQKALDVAKGALDEATGNRAAMETKIAGKESDQAQLNALKASQEALLDAAVIEDTEAQQMEGIESGNLAGENSRIDKEKALFEKVINMLRGLSEDDEGGYSEDDQANSGYPNPDDDSLAQVDSLMSIIDTADPEKVEQLIALLNQVIANGEVKRQEAQKQYDDAVTRASLAADDLKKKQDDLTTTNNALGDVAAEISDCQSQLEDLKIAENLADIEHTDKEQIRDGKKIIYDAEIARIDSELTTFEEAIADLNKLEEVVSLLA